jgi:hypothetical protein
MLTSGLRASRAAARRAVTGNRSFASPSITEIFKTMEYGPAPEDDTGMYAWIKSHKQNFGIFIDGQWQHPEVTQQ